MRPAAAVRVATSGVEGGGRRGRVHDEGKRRAAAGAWAAGGGEENFEIAAAFVHSEREHDTVLSVRGYNARPSRVPPRGGGLQDWAFSTYFR